MSKNKLLLKRAIILTTTLSVAAGITSLLNITETKARSRNSRSSAKINGSTTKRPITNATPTQDPNSDEHYTKDFISPPMSLYGDKNKKDSSKSRRSSNNRTVINVSTKN